MLLNHLQVPVALKKKQTVCVEKRVPILSLLDKFKVTSEHVLIIGHCTLM